MHQAYYGQIHRKYEHQVRRRQRRDEELYGDLSPDGSQDALLNADESASDKYRRKIRHPPKPYWQSALRCLWPLSVPLFFAFLIWVNSTYDPQSFHLNPSMPLVGALAINSALNQPVHVANGEVTGPHSMLVEKDAMYISSSDGRILKIVRNSVVAVVRLNDEKNCRGLMDEIRCGRPVGIRRLDTDRLLVVDAYHGIYSVDFEKKEARILLSASETIVDGHKLMALHDIVVVSPEEILISQTTTKWHALYKHYIRMEHLPNGRILRLSLPRGKLSVLVEGLIEPRGLELLVDRDTLLIAETGAARVLQFSLSSGRLSVWADRLPGLPSGIRTTPDQKHFWVAFDETRRDTTGNDLTPIAERLSEWPFVRKTLLWFISNDMFRSFYHHFSPKHAMAIKFGLNGKAVSSVHSRGGLRARGSLSEVHESEDFLLAISSHANFVARFPRNVIPA